eukprot:gb/GFBE01062899.1/.p1 GENE.gb/GFBE01062899.1/~~gb/GFBE01062899.1/.p1  ORF type:complete len:866 (+),score=240.71 gb/GFBE01062899.1/:1-2598(+)
MRKSKTAKRCLSEKMDAQIKEQFEFFDTSNNGSIELDELVAVFQRLDPKWTEEQVATLMKSMDANNDGRVSYNEFVDYIFKTCPGDDKVLLTEDQIQVVKERYAEEGVYDPQCSDDLLTQAKNAHYYRGPMKAKALELLDLKADPNMTDRAGVTVLMHMTTKIDPPFAKLIISKGADVSRHSPDMNCPIFIAASKQNTDLLRLFLMPDTTPVVPDETEEGEAGAEEDLREVSSQALVSKMQTLTPTQIRELVQKRADLNYKSSQGWTPLTCAAFYDRKECVETIIRAGALVHGSNLRIDLKNRQGRSALHIAARKGLSEIMELLLSNSAKPDVRDFDGWTPLHHACFNGNSSAVMVLVNKGADIDLKAGNGLTPYQVTRLREKPGTLSTEALELIKPSDAVDFGKCLLPILKDESKSCHDKLEDLVCLPGVNGNMNRLRLHEHFFDPVTGPNKVKLQKVWSLLVQPLLCDLRTGDVGMAKLRDDAGDEETDIYMNEHKRRLKQQKQFVEMWMQETKGPMPSIHWTHDNRGPYKDELKAFMDVELAHFKTELDAVYAKVREADCGEDLIDLPMTEVLDESLLSQLGAHPELDWLKNLNAAEAFEQLRLVGAVTGQEDDLAAQCFAEMLTYEPHFSSGKPFWKNVYRKWLACYAKMADAEFHQKLDSLMKKFNADHGDAALKAVYRKGPVKTYQRMIADEKDRGLVASADTFEGRTVSASCLDMIRGTISVDCPKAVLALIQFFRKLDGHLDKMKLTQVKNFFHEEAEGMDGFRYIELNTLFRCGVRAGASDRPGKSLMISLVGEVAIVLNDYVEIKQRRSLQYKLCRGFFDWDDVEKEETADDEQEQSSAKRLKLRGNKALYEDDS